MKKLTFLLIAVVGLIATACSGASEADRVAEKISRGDVLTQSDYTILIDYCGEYARKAQIIQDKIDNLPSGDPSDAELNKELDELDAEYAHTGIFFSTLKNSTPEQLGSENVKKVDGYSSLIWFDAPEWAETLSPDDAAGLIETVAPADSDSSVIAAPALDLHEESK